MAVTRVRSQTPAGRLTLLLLVGCLSMFAPLSMDLYLPALPALNRDLGGSPSLVQLTLTACLLGLAAGQFIVGPLSNARGRRRPLFVGLAAYVPAFLLVVGAQGLVSPNAAALALADHAYQAGLAPSNRTSKRSGTISNSIRSPSAASPRSPTSNTRSMPPSRAKPTSCGAPRRNLRMYSAWPLSGASGKSCYTYYSYSQVGWKQTVAVRVRELTGEEQETIRKLAHARMAPARQVERARVIELASHGWRVPAIAGEVRLHEQTVRAWIKRFNALGLSGLEDAPRPGRPATYTPEQVGEVVATALSDPQTLGLPFGCWTLDRLEVYLNEEHNLPIKRSRIDEVLIAEGLRWRAQETWFGERAGRPGDAGAQETKKTHEREVDPAFAQKRGPSNGSTRRHLQVVS